MGLHLELVHRWYRYRYHDDPRPEVLFRVVNAGVVLPLTCAAGILLGATSVALTLLALVSGIEYADAIHLHLIIENWLLFAALPMVLGTGGVWLWLELAAREGSRRFADAAAVLVAASLVVGVYALWPALLTALAVLSCLDVWMFVCPWP